MKEKTADKKKSIREKRRTVPGAWRMIALAAFFAAHLAFGADSLVVNPDEYQFAWNGTYPAENVCSSASSGAGVIDTGAFMSASQFSSLIARYRTMLASEARNLTSKLRKGLMIIFF